MTISIKQMRRNYANLKFHRHNLQREVAQYLRSASGPSCNYEMILTYKEAMLELGTSMDNSLEKLQRTRERKNEIYEKLLEHFAAAATLVPKVLDNRATA